jgi:hypothetical protein
MRLFIPVAVYFWGTWILLHASLAAAGPIEGVHYDKKAGTLTVHVQETPLNEILQAVSVASGLKLSIQGDLNRPVTMDLTAVPLDRAIHRLVQPNNSAMIYSKKEDGAIVLTSVKVFDRGGTLSSPPENLPMPRVGGGGNNRRNRGRGANPATWDAGSRMNGVAGITGSQGTTGRSAVAGVGR